MHAPLIIDSKDAKWIMLKKILKFFDTRTAKKILAREKISPEKGIAAVKIVLTSMFFSKNIAYVISELKTREKLRTFLKIEEVPEKTMLYRFLSRIEDKSFVNMILRILNKQCRKRRKTKTSIIVDSTDVQLDINCFRRRIKKEDLEDKEFKWGYSPSKGYYIGYKLTIAIDKSNLMPLAFLLHEGSPNDAKLFCQVLKELKKRRIIRKGDVVIADKGYYSYKNYLKGITRFRIVPLIFPRKNFSLGRLLGLLSYPLDVFCSNSLRKDVFIKLVRKFRKMILRWERYRSIRSRMEDLFKLAKNAFSLDRLHRYTKKSVKKFVGLNVLLLGMVVSMGIRRKEELHKLVYM